LAACGFDVPLGAPAGRGGCITVCMSGTETVSVIIPALNEAEHLARTVEMAADPRAEIIVVDGGSQDATCDIARRCSARVLQSDSGRAAQMNFGARQARGQALLFLHADTVLPQHYCGTVLETLAQPGIVAGAFRLGINAPGRSLRLIERSANWRSAIFQLPYGDQALFLTAPRFREIGGFADLPIMEDFDLIRRLRRSGRIALAPDRVMTSGRRWRKLGPWKTTLINQWVILRYLAGSSPEKLAEFYRKRR